MDVCNVNSNYKKRTYKDAIDGLVISKLSVINAYKNKGTLNIERLCNDIHSKLRSINGLCLDISLSEDPDNYANAIDNMADYISGTYLEREAKATDKETIDKETINKIKRQLKAAIKSKYLPAVKTKVEQSIEAVLPEIGMVSQQKLNVIPYREAISSIYENSITIATYRAELFNQSIHTATIIDVEADVPVLVRTERELNKRLQTFKEREFKKLRAFLDSVNELKPLQEFMATKYYYNNNKVSKVDDTLLIMYNYIQQLKKEKKYTDQLKEDWIKAISGKTDGTPTLLDAVNAFFNLQYFDKALKATFGDYLKIDRDYDEPVTIEKDLTGEKVIYKYTLQSGNVNQTAGWQTAEYQDAIAKTAGYSQVLVSSIPLLSYKTGNQVSVGSVQRLNLVYFHNAISSLRMAIEQAAYSKNSKPLKDLLANEVTNPENMFTILGLLFNKSNNNGLTNSGNAVRNATDANGKNILNDFDLNILYSIYETCFNPRNRKSYYNVESEYIRNNGLGNAYSIIGCLKQLITSTRDMNFLESVYDYSENPPRQKIRVRRKFNSNSSIWDFIKVTNKHVRKRTDYDQVKTRYKLRTREEEKNATLILTDQNLTLELDYPDHILAKNSKASLIQIPGREIPSFLDKNANLNLSLDTPAEMGAILNGSDQQSKQVLALLSFIDDMLNTQFSKDKDGLLILSQFLKVGGQFSDLLSAAIRALRIMQINDALNNDETHQRSEIISFLKDNPDVYTRPWYKEDNTYMFMTKNEEGAYLTTVGTSNGWIDSLVLAKSIVVGTSSQAVNKDLDGNNKPNWTNAYLGADLPHYLAEASDPVKNYPTRHLFFSQKRGVIKGTIVDDMVQLKSGVRKLIKDMSTSELIYHSIVDKFFDSLVDSDLTYIQATTLSDKTKYVGSIVNLKEAFTNLTDEKGNIITNQGKDLIYSSNVKEVCTNILMNSIGRYYREVWEKTLDKYEKLFGFRDVKLINDKLSTLNEQELLELAERRGRELGEKIDIYRDKDFRQLSNGLGINELLYYYATDLYSSADRVKERLDQERIEFVYDLIEHNVQFEVERVKDDKINTNTGIGNFIRKYKGANYEQEWISGNYLILAKARNKKTGELKDIEEIGSVSEDEEIILNPFLESYFSVDSVFANNVRHSLTGSEINHKVKEKIDGIKVLRDYGVDVSLLELEEGMSISQIQIALQQKLNEDPTNESFNRAMTVFRQFVIRLQEQGAQGAQLKRNVIISATLNRFTQNLLEGVPEEMRCAVMQDVQAKVHNFDGAGCSRKGKYSSQTIDAHDGFGYIHPCMAILENKSLQDNEVGVMKKNILHGMNQENGCAVLFKYAAAAITNQSMRDSTMSDISLENIMYKTSNERWSNRSRGGKVTWNFVKQEGEEIDLTRCDYMGRYDANGIRESDGFDFDYDILHGKSLLYKNKGVLTRITNFERDDNGDYYTEEVQVYGDTLKEVPNTKKRLYHYFDDHGTHRTSEVAYTEDQKFGVRAGSDNIGEVELWHTIDSIYELWQVLGGVQSVEKTDAGIVDSEASLYALTEFVNYVAIDKSTNPEDKNRKKDLSQVNYDQPLKRAFIAYVINSSAVKNGAGNVNPSTSYYDDAKLRTITVKTKGHGVQQDSDHVAVEAQMTEFSQVITSLDAGGRMHDYVRQIYTVLGQVALQASGVELEAVQIFREINNKSKLYDLLGRTVMNNIKDGNKGLLRSIAGAIAKEFNMNSDHVYDQLKMPFSDHNIYSQILGTFASIINNKSIKRKYPGTGMVMLPGYNTIQLFDYQGEVYKFSDLVTIAENKLGLKKRLAVTATNNTDYQKQIVRQILQEEQDKIPFSEDFTQFYPGDNVEVQISNTDIVSGKGEQQRITLTLDDLGDYYKFLDENKRRKFLAEKLYGVEVSGEYIKEWRAKKDGTHLNSDGTVKTNKAFQITVKGFDGFFEIVKDNDTENTWSIHFKTGAKDSEGNYIRDKYGRMVPNKNFPKDIKDKLFKASALVIPEGHSLSTYGEVTLGGQSGLRRFADLGFSEVGSRKVDLVQKDGTVTKDSIGVYQSNIKIETRKNIMKPRDLRPAIVEYTLEDETKSNIWQHWAVKAVYENNISDRSTIQRAFDNLNKGIFEEGYYQKGEDGKIKIVYTGKTKKVVNLVNEPAECIIPNIYTERFGLKSATSLVEARKQVAKVSKIPTLISSSRYDLAFTSGTGKHTYISFSPIVTNEDEKFRSTIVPWNNTLVEERKGIDLTNLKDGQVINRIYAIDNDNVKILEIGREKINEGVIYNQETGLYTNTDGEVLEDQSLYRYDKRTGKVLEKVIFVTKRNAKEFGEKKTYNYTLYTIDRNKLAQVIVADSEQLRQINTSKYIGKILADIYNSGSFTGVQANTEMTHYSALTISNSLNSFSQHIGHDQDLVNYLINGDPKRTLKGLLNNAISNNIKTVQENDKQVKQIIKPRISIRGLAYTSAKNQYYKALAKRVQASFEKSLYFTSSRIPAQTHQSFMQMKVAGFTGGGVNYTYVSHFQTWLQGSDY